VTPFDFIRVPNADTCGTSLRAIVDSRVTFEHIQNVFGKPDPNGFWDDENGYDGNEYAFVESDTEYVVCLYSRWGSWRVGAHNHDAAERFAAWVKEYCK
jgi:hypothetical protein